MALLRPSLTLILDLDERSAREETVLEIKRSYTHICTPIIRTHKTADEEPIRNVARCLVNMGTYQYWSSADEDADERWNTILAPWIGNLLHRVGNNMKVFNDRQRKIKLPEVVFDRLDIELQGGDFVVSLHPDPLCLVTSELASQVGLVRELLNAGTFEGAVRVALPTDESYEHQRAQAWEIWVAEHPEAQGSVLESKDEMESSASLEVEKSREQYLREDAEAKSYENTAVPPTDSGILPPVKRDEEEEEPEQFTFDVEYNPWGVAFADGTQRTYDVLSRAFTDEL